MNTRTGSLTLAALALVAALAVASSAFANSIVGLVRDGYRETPAANVKITLIGGGPDSAVASTTTSVDGIYRFDGLTGDGYYLYFSDPSDRFWPAWYDGGPAFEDAVEVDPSGSAETSADMDLNPIHVKYAANLTTATPSADSSTTVFIGESATLETTATDAFWGFPLFGMHVTLQSSADQNTWTDLSPALDPEWDGTYSATVSPQLSGVRYYRFAIADALDAEATASAGVAVEAKVPVTSWQGAEFTNTTVNAITSPSPFQTLSISGRLLDRLGAADTGVHVTVQGSSDGAAWAETGVAVTSATDGWYRANVLSGEWAFYRLAYTVGANQLSSASSPVAIRSPWAIQWTSIPGSGVKKGKKYAFTGKVWGAANASSKLLYFVIERPGKTGWKTVTKGRLAFKAVGSDAVFTVILNAKTRSGYNIRVSAPTIELNHLPNTGGISAFTYAK